MIDVDYAVFKEACHIQRRRRARCPNSRNGFNRKKRFIRHLIQHEAIYFDWLKCN